jgi:hypothetical protein
MSKITNNIRHLQACEQNFFVCIQKVFGNRFSLNTFSRKSVVENETSGEKFSLSIKQ